jgi:glycerophosphoryl diester phosphodiesterase
MNLWLISPLVCLGAIALSECVSGAEPVAPTSTSTPTRPFFQKPWALGSHRGGRGLWPENTLLAFKTTAERWPDAVIETDARLTADGQVVLLHDDTLDRTTDGKGPLSKLTLAEVRKLDAGYPFTRDGGKTFPYRGRGVTIPTLAEALKAASRSRFEIELKPVDGVADAVVEVIRAAKAEDRVLLASFDPRLAARARKLAPRIACCYQVLDGMRLLDQLRRGDWTAYQPTAEVLSMTSNMPRQFKITPDELRAIRAKGIQIQIHTINTRRSMKELLERGYDSILSDRPDLLAEAVAEARKAK